MASTSAVKPLINRLLCVGHANVLSLLRYDDGIFFQITVKCSLWSAVIVGKFNILFSLIDLEILGKLVH